MIEKARGRQLGSGTDLEKGEITILGLIPLVAHPRLPAIVPSSGSLEQATGHWNLSDNIKKLVAGCALAHAQDPNISANQPLHHRGE